MRVMVFGAGALGSVVGGLLTRRHEVVLVGREAHVRAIEQSGLVIGGMVEAVFVPEAATSPEGLGTFDLVIVTVKAYDTASALGLIAPALGEGTAVVSLQNGLQNAELLARTHPGRGVVGVTSMGANLIGPGKVLYAGQGDTFFGSAGAPPRMVQRVAQAFNEVGLDAEVADDIGAEIWLKGIVNASINPLTAIARCKNGRLLLDEDLLEVSRAACEEAAAVAAAAGIGLGGREPFGAVMDVLRRTAENRSSMLQDMERRKRTEIDEITGEIVRRGKELGVGCPVNHALWHLVRSLSQGR